LKADWLKQDKAKLEAITLPQLSYSHSDARLEDKTKFVEGVMGRKATVKSLEFPEMTVQVVGNTAIVRHLWVSQKGFLQRRGGGLGTCRPTDGKRRRAGRRLWRFILPRNPLTAGASGLNLRS